MAFLVNYGVALQKNFILSHRFFEALALVEEALNELLLFVAVGEDFAHGLGDLPPLWARPPSTTRRLSVLFLFGTSSPRVRENPVARKLKNERSSRFGVIARLPHHSTEYPAAVFLALPPDYTHYTLCPRTKRIFQEKRRLSGVWQLSTALELGRSPTTKPKRSGGSSKVC
jgi:hypothetical protein